MQPTRKLIFSLLPSLLRVCVCVVGKEIDFFSVVFSLFFPAFLHLSRRLLCVCFSSRRLSQHFPVLGSPKEIDGGEAGE